MKSTIASVLIRNAVDSTKSSEIAHHASNVQGEVSTSLSAHLMLALALEGIANEVGDVAFQSALWDKIEKADTVAKWYFLSTLDQRKPFQSGEEPITTIQKLVSIRNRIAHPKVIDFGDDLIIQNKDGKIIRNPSNEYVLQEGDSIIAGLGKLLDVFNWETAFQMTQSSIKAINILRSHLSIEGLEWVDDFAAHFRK